MIQIIDKQQCCGCSACVQKCPKQCISLKEDNEGFLYPRVDTKTCIDCGLCEKVCPVLNPYETREPLQVLAAINKDEKIRMESSSGGIFTLLAEPIIREGGVVFGARFDEEWQVTLDYTETIEGLAAFRGSKYVQARTGETYKQCEQFLKAGRKVLYTGTPCQIAGLHHYLRKEYDNLISCDLACHGVPSPLVWHRYLESVCEENKSAQRAVDGKSTVSSSLNAMSLIKDIKFREKKNGWKKFRFVLKFNESSDEVEKSSVLSSIHYQNLFFHAFNSGIILRPSCYICSIKNSCRSKSDITMADFWGINVIDSSLDDDKGTSLIIANSEKGRKVVDQLPLLLKKEFDYELALRYNGGLRVGSFIHPKRNSFFEDFSKSKSIMKSLKNALKPNFTMKFNRYKNAIVKRLKKIL